MFKDNEFSKLKILKVCDMDVYVVDKHQYVLPIWASKSIDKAENYELVSIDYHPDTNPPFWQKAYFKAVNENRGEDDKYIDMLSDGMISKVERNDLESIVKVADKLNNDEHINTALKLKYINNYHMLNCMDNHLYTSGTHYLIDEMHFSSLKDSMFESVKFQIPSKKFILDIDLDYFLDVASFSLQASATTLDEFILFKRLVRECEFITIARSIKYFNYLRRDNFEIEECEELMLTMLENILKNNIS
ncbi:MAG: UPF0489 family protein [Acidaminobacteraceae bacterium]